MQPMYYIGLDVHKQKISYCKGLTRSLKSTRMLVFPSADFQDLSPRRFHNHSPIIFMIMHPPFSSSFTHRFHDHAPTLGVLTF